MDQKLDDNVTNVGQWRIHHNSPLGEYLRLIVLYHHLKVFLYRYILILMINYLIQKWIKTRMVIQVLSCPLYTTFIFQIFSYVNNVGQWRIHHNSPLGEYLFLIVSCHHLKVLLYRYILMIHVN